jgi:hypothetical protein
MSIATTFLHVLAIAFAQDTPKPPSNEAQELMSDVIAAQYNAEGARPMSNFSIDLFLRERGEHPREFGFYLLYSETKQKIFEIAIDDVENNTQVRKGFDGKRYWLKENGGEKQVLSGHEYTEDRQAIDDGIDLSADLMLILDLAQFADKNPPTTLTIEADGTRVLEGRILRQQQLFTYRIHVATDQLLPSIVDFILFDDEQQLKQIQRFATLAYKEYHGRSVPQVIYEFDTDDSEALPLRIYEIHGLDWGPKSNAPSDDKKPSQGQDN